MLLPRERHFKQCDPDREKLQFVKSALTLPVMPSSHCCMSVRVSAVALIQLPANAPHKAVEDSPSGGAPATHMEAQDGGSGSWLWSSSALAAAVHQMENLSLCLSNKYAFFKVMKYLVFFIASLHFNIFSWFHSQLNVLNSYRIKMNMKQNTE